MRAASLTTRLAHLREATFSSPISPIQLPLPLRASFAALAHSCGKQCRRPLLRMGTAAVSDAAAPTGGGRPQEWSGLIRIGARERPKAATSVVLARPMLKAVMREAGCRHIMPAPRKPSQGQRGCRSIACALLMRAPACRWAATRTAGVRTLASTLPHVGACIASAALR